MKKPQLSNPQSSSLLTTIIAKKQRLEAHVGKNGKLNADLLKNLQEWFKVELTYTSNAIEGNTLSRAETVLVLEKSLTVAGKTLREHLEAVNHAQAFELVVQLAETARQQNGKVRITENMILDLHRLILQKIDNDNAGHYRSVPVRIAGTPSLTTTGARLAC